MKRVIVFAAINLLVASHTVQASLAHLPCNIAYAIAGLAGSTADRLRAQDESERAHDAALAFEEVKAAYSELAQHVEYSSIDNVDASILMSHATERLAHATSAYASQLHEHRDLVARMIALSERLYSAGP